MALPYLFHIRAHEEFINASQYYEVRQEGLGKRFIVNVEQRLLQISKEPEAFNKKYKNFREIKVESFPYLIVYEYLKNKQLIHIAAIYHGKRNPRHKYRRRK